MKKIWLMAVAAIALLTACQNEDDFSGSSDDFSMEATTADYSVTSLPVTTVSGDITSSVTWDNDHVWEIEGVVGVKNGATLTIEAGTYIKASSTASDPNGVLVITKGSKINAVGTATDPIVFTSYKLLDGTSGNTPEAGDFGGVILLGDAPTNRPTSNNIIEGLNTLPDSTDYKFGGSNSTHNAGTMQYVRIEYAGSDLSGPNSGNEVNGLTLGAVGSNTTIDHIQVSYGLDDGVEFFGGTVDLEYVIVFAQADDGLDFDWGYTGSITKALVLADLDGEHTTSGGNSDSNGIELDNDGGGSDNTPITRPEITDLSVIGVSTSSDADEYENGIHVRRNGQIDLTNATVTGYNTGIYWQDPSVASNSSWYNFDVHGFDYPAISAPGTAVSLGNPRLNSTSTSSSAEDWDLSQPFFNATSALDLSGNTGAFFTDQGWAQASWTNYFE